MSAKLRIAVAGAGLIGARHIAEIEAHDRCTIAAIVEPNVEVARPYLDRGIEVLSDLKALESVGEIAADGIILATPTALHAQQAIWAMKCPMCALIEKPITNTVEEALGVCRAETASTARILVGHHRRHHPLVAVLRDALVSGVIGDPVTATMIWSVRKPEAYFEASWRAGPDGSPVLINSVHDVDLLRLLFGEITSVHAQGSNRQRGANRVETATAMLRFDTDVIATLTTSDTAPGPWGFELGTGENPNIATTGEDFLFICGSKGAIAFPSLNIWEHAEDWSMTPQRRRIETNPEQINERPLRRQLSHFLDVIEGRAEPLCSAADGMKSLEATAEIEAQARASAGLD